METWAATCLAISIKALVTGLSGSAAVIGVPASPPGVMGTPAAIILARAAVLDPMASMALAGGPMKVMPEPRSPGATLTMLAQLFARKGMAATFADEEAAIFQNGPAPEIDDFGFSEDDTEERLASANLSDEEREVMESLLNPSAIVEFADDEGVAHRAAVKIGKTAFHL